MLELLFVIVGAIVALVVTGGMVTLLQSPCSSRLIDHWITNALSCAILTTGAALLVGARVFGRSGIEMVARYWAPLLPIFYVPYLLVGASCKISHNAEHHMHVGMGQRRVHRDELTRKNDDRVWLERKMSGLGGLRVIAVAALTLCPSIASWKLRGEFRLPAVGPAYLVYHGIGTHLWFQVNHLRSLDRAPHPEGLLALPTPERNKELDRLVPLARFWDKLGWVVFFLVVLSLSAAIDISGNRLDLPDFLYSALGIAR